MQYNPRIDPGHPLRTGQGRNVAPAIRTTLYLGRNIPATDEIPSERRVTDYALRAFLASVVAPRFDSFTVLSGTGYWRGEREDVVLVSFVYDEISTDAQVRIEEIRAEYVRTFSQESVLRTDEQVRLSFD